MTAPAPTGYFFPPRRVGCHRGEYDIKATGARPLTSPEASSDRVWPPKSLYLMITKHSHAHRPWGRPWSRSFWLGASLCCFLRRRPRRFGRQGRVGLMCLGKACQHDKAHQACRLRRTLAQTSCHSTFYSHMPQNVEARGSSQRPIERRI